MIGSFKPRGGSAPNGRRSRKMPARLPKPALLPSCSRRSPSSLPRASPAGLHPDHRHRRVQPRCDGQILVLEDMLGLSPRVPKFVKEYAQIGEAIENAVKSYANEVPRASSHRMPIPIRCATSLPQSRKSPKWQAVSRSVAVLLNLEARLAR